MDVVTRTALIQAMVVADPGETVFTPAVGSGSGVIVRKKVPRRAVRTIVFAYCAPLAFREARSPPPPVGCAFVRLLESQRFLSHTTSSPVKCASNAVRCL